MKRLATTNNNTSQNTSCCCTTQTRHRCHIRCRRPTTTPPLDTDKPASFRTSGRTGFPRRENLHRLAGERPPFNGLAIMLRDPTAGRALGTGSAERATHISNMSHCPWRSTGGAVAWHPCHLEVATTFATTVPCGGRGASGGMLGQVFFRNKVEP
jgi:hypothetical protein